MKCQSLKYKNNSLIYHKSLGKNAIAYSNSYTVMFLELANYFMNMKNKIGMSYHYYPLNKI